MAKEEALFPLFTPRLAEVDRVGGARVQGAAPCLVVHPYLINNKQNKQTPCVEVRAASVTPVHSNEVLQWTGRNKIQVFCKFRVLVFFYIESVGEPTDLL